MRRNSQTKELLWIATWLYGLLELILTVNTAQQTLGSMVALFMFAFGFYLWSKKRR